MKILVTGRGGAGSWEVRGRQLGAAMGATVKPMATLEDIKAHDVVLVVKKVPDELHRALMRARVPWVYDVVDAYPQPGCSLWNQAQCVAWLRAHLAMLAPDRIVFPNRKMQQDSGYAGEVVYHHHRPGIAQNLVRERIRRIGYEGSAKYLDGWVTAIGRVCQERGLQFTVNPATIAELDVIVAMRGGVWDGYAQRNWKSNVKLANAHASGTPFIGARESGYEETACGCEYWADTPAEFARALDWLDSHTARSTVSERFKASAYSVEQAAEAMKCALKF